jgi:hypothetical protein
MRPATRSLWLPIGLFLLSPGIARASDAYALRFDISSYAAPVSALCPIWVDSLVFHNPTGSDLTVRLLGVSNGNPPASPTELVIPAGRTVSANGRTNWFTSPFSPIWLVHLDVPDGLIVQSKGEVHSNLCFGGAPPSVLPDMGAFQLPVHRALKAPGEKQMHLGIEIGSEDTYTNIGVFNAGTVPATALIEVFQACDDALIDSRQLSVPPNTLVQVNGLGAFVPKCPELVIETWRKYATVTVNQPSLSYAVSRMTIIGGEGPPGVSFSAVLP